MQETFLTKTEVINNFANCNTLEAVIRRINQTAAAGGKVICELRINETILEDEDIEKMRELPVQNIDTLSYKVSTTRELLTGALDSVGEFIEKMQTVICNTADTYRAGEMQKAQNMFESILGGFDWTLNALINIKSNLSELDMSESQMTECERLWSQAELSSSKIVSEMIQSFQKKDFILLSDLLEYDLTDGLNAWLTFVKHVSPFAKVKVATERT